MCSKEADVLANCEGTDHSAFIKVMIKKNIKVFVLCKWEITTRTLLLLASMHVNHGVQRRMISVVSFFVFLR